MTASSLRTVKRFVRPARSIPCRCTVAAREREGVFELNDLIPTNVVDLSIWTQSLSVDGFTVSLRTGGFSGNPGPRCCRSSHPRSDRRPSVPMPMSRPVAGGRLQVGLRRLGLRQLLPGFLQPPLISGRTHDAGRTTAGESGFAGNDHCETDRASRQDVLHTVPTRLRAGSNVLRHRAP